MLSCAVSGWCDIGPSQIQTLVNCNGVMLSDLDCDIQDIATFLGIDVRIANYCHGREIINH